MDGHGRPRLELTSLANCVDGRLVAILSFGMMAITGLSNILMINASYDSNDRNRMRLFFYGLLYEVSSASTHVSAALGAARPYQVRAAVFPYR